MKKTVTDKFFGGGKYASPEIEMYESVVEQGFLTSLDPDIEDLDINGNGVIDEDEWWYFY